jgi:hypothetical protein
MHKSGSSTRYIAVSSFYIICGLYRIKDHEEWGIKVVDNQLELAMLRIFIRKMHSCILKAFIK